MYRRNFHELLKHQSTTEGERQSKCDENKARFLRNAHQHENSDERNEEKALKRKHTTEKHHKNKLCDAFCCKTDSIIMIKPIANLPFKRRRGTPSCTIFSTFLAIIAMSFNEIKNISHQSRATPLVSAHRFHFVNTILTSIFCNYKNSVNPSDTLCMLRVSK